MAEDGVPRPRKPTPAERREQRAPVEDPAEVLDAYDIARTAERFDRLVDAGPRRLGSAA